MTTCPLAVRRWSTSNSLELAGGTFWMGAPAGDGYADDGEGPVHEVQLSTFSIAPTTVTNADFAAFCDATGYVTLAEADQWSFVFGGLLPDDFPPTRAVAAAPWWRQVEGADWRHPAGPHTTFDRRARPSRHPRHVGRRDGVLPLERHPSADRGRMGVRRPWRSRSQAVPVGRRPRTGWRAPDERVPGDVPRGQHRRRRVRRDRAGAVVPTQRATGCTR